MFKRERERERWGREEEGRKRRRRRGESKKEEGGRGWRGGGRRVSVLDGKMVAFTNLINCPALSICTCAVELSHHLHTIASLVEPRGYTYFVSYCPPRIL